MHSQGLGVGIWVGRPSHALGPQLGGNGRVPDENRFFLTDTIVRAVAGETLILTAMCMHVSFVQLAIAAHKRGVHVLVVMSKFQGGKPLMFEEGSEGDNWQKTLGRLQSEGVPTLVTTQALLHCKAWIVGRASSSSSSTSSSSSSSSRGGDGPYVGNANFSPQAFSGTNVSEKMVEADSASADPFFHFILKLINAECPDLVAMVGHRFISQRSQEEKEADDEQSLAHMAHAGTGFTTFLRSCAKGGVKMGQINNSGRGVSRRACDTGFPSWKKRGGV